MQNNFTPTVLTIAGSDPYGGAGIQIDCKTIHALGGYAFSVITALTAQNSTGVKALHSTSPEIFRQQLKTLLEDIKPDAVKIGMLANKELIEIVIEMIKRYELKNIVLDTVLVSSSGKKLLDQDAIEIMIKKLFPVVDIITPNIPEINTFLGSNYAGEKEEVEKIAKALIALGANSVLIKGGHSSDQEEAKDYLVSKYLEIDTFTTARVNTTHTHGTGCLLSSAVATNLALGLDLTESTRKAKNFLYEKLKHAKTLNLNYKDKKYERKEPIF
ncbi:MAG: bifunctional hydroxymethylpyrimidine kinase/phosphomethylpyrimidine kinase [Campylobacterota bacterium]|nr:bifunctional hydroxymethylpyrimidine kinase/phosphomethylpyrimidine kinase [Campylobacterota bacterium]